MPIEKKWLQPEARIQKDGSTKIVRPWEITATGKEVHELDDAFKDSGPAMMHDGFNEWKSIGETTITKPDGSTDVVRADKERLYRDMPGFCVQATRPTFVLDVPWEGSMKRRGLRYSKTIYRDGTATVVEEY